MIKTLRNVDRTFSETVPLKDVVRNSVKFVMSQIYSPHLQPFPTAPPSGPTVQTFVVVLTLLTTKKQAVIIIINETQNVLVL